MIKKNRQQKNYLITNLIFNDKKEIGYYEIINLENNDVMRCELHKVKDEQEYQLKIKEHREYAETLDYYCYAPITVRVDKDGIIYSGSISQRDYSTNLDYFADKYEEITKK